MIGSQISHFSITAKLGEGGMGEVYRATDTRLQREVAVKVLPHSFLEDPQRLARFEREAQLLASLSHPNIAGIHGLEKQGDERYLILELIEGEDLADRLSRGPVPLDEALQIAHQIAEALEAAHDKGIIHRDLKPANVKITPSGQVKVLDFGLAKALEAETTSGSGPDLANSPTLTMAATQAGIILGTAAYMAPEQAAAQPADRRADVWSFGVVLTEMLTGRQLFQGETASHVLAAVLQSDVDIAEALPKVPAPIRDLIGRCLRKEVRSRLQSIGDARIAIEEYQADPGATEPVPTSAVEATRPSVVSRLAPWAVAAGLGVALVVSLLPGDDGGATEPQGERLLQVSLLPPEETTFDLDPQSPGPAAVSPDGERVAFSARSADGSLQLWVRQLDAVEAQPLQDTEGAAYPFWSPDGRSLGFFNEDGQLLRIDVAGGPPTVLADAPNGKGGSWGTDGTILFAPAHNTSIQRIDDGGGEVAEVTVMEEGDISHRHPRLLPDGKNFIYLERTRVEGSSTASQLVLASLDDSAERILVRTPAAGQLVSDHLLFLHEDTLMARPFDLETLDFAGDARPLADDLMLISVGAAVGLFSASENGVLVYGTGQNRPGTTMQWFGRNGGIEARDDEVSRFMAVSLSPDEGLAALAIIDPVIGSQDLWIHETDRGLRTRFTFDQGNDTAPVWSPDGERIAFTSDRGTQWAVYAKSIGGVGEEELVYALEDADSAPTDWSPDGRYLAMDVFGSDDAQYDVWVLPMVGGEEARGLIQSGFNESGGKFSPDGAWLAYNSDESGRAEVFVVPFPGPGRKWQISTAGGRVIAWKDDGTEIYYQDPGGQILAAEVGVRGETFLVGQVDTLFTGPPMAVDLNIDVSGDGQRFLALMPEQRMGTRPLNLVFGWPQLLARR